MLPAVRQVECVDEPWPTRAHVDGVELPACDGEEVRAVRLDQVGLVHPFFLDVGARARDARSRRRGTAHRHRCPRRCGRRRGTQLGAAHAGNTPRADDPGSVLLRVGQEPAAGAQSLEPRRFGRFREMRRGGRVAGGLRGQRRRERCEDDQGCSELSHLRLSVRSGRWDCHTVRSGAGTSARGARVVLA